MPGYFSGFNIGSFWENSEYAQEHYVSDPPSDELIASIEEELGFKLPGAYLALMRSQNGGTPQNVCFPTETPTSWSPDHIQISGIFGIGRKKRYSLCGDRGSTFWQDMWDYPGIGVYICDCPSAGHDMVALDYRECGPQGEPQVVHVDQDSDFEITFLAPDFESFVRGLVNESTYDTSAQDLLDDLERIERGGFSPVLAELVRKSGDPEMETILRSIARMVTAMKGGFHLHADELSQLMYDLQFYLYTSANKIKTADGFLKPYPTLIALAAGGFSGRGYGPGFVEEWIEARLSNREIVSDSQGYLAFSDAYREQLMQKLSKYR